MNIRDAIEKLVCLHTSIELTFLVVFAAVVLAAFFF